MDLIIFYEYFKRKNNHFAFFKSDIFWSATTAIFTLLLAAVAYFQLNESNRTEREKTKIEAEQFLQKLKSDFFTKDERDLMILLEMNALKFKVIKNDSGYDLAIFEKNIPSKFSEYTNAISPSRGFYYSTEIDDFLLSHFEDLGKMNKEGLIDSYNIDQDFGYYISTCYENSAIKEYLEWIKSDKNDKDLYQNFDFIYKKLNSKN